MQESEFWDQFEYRLCTELSGMPEKSQRRYWCDGFLPENYDVDSTKPTISGKVWLGIGDKTQVSWTFSLLLPKGFRTREEVDWASLLPPADVTCWLALDEKRGHIEIEPASAIPDFP